MEIRHDVLLKKGIRYDRLKIQSLPRETMDEKG